MKRTRYSLPTAFALVMLLCCAVAGVPRAGSSSARAQEIEGSRRSKTPTAGPVIPLPPGQVEQTQNTEVASTRRVASAKKWEYCAITGVRQVGNPPAMVAVVLYFPSKTEHIEVELHEDAQAKAIAKLGEEGWEMVGIREGRDGSNPVIYFKRAK